MPQAITFTVAAWGMRSFVQRSEWSWGVACFSPRLVGGLNFLALTYEAAPSLVPTTAVGERYAVRETTPRRASNSPCWFAMWAPRVDPTATASAPGGTAHPLLPPRPRQARECRARTPVCAVEAFLGIRLSDAGDSVPVPARYARCVFFHYRIRTLQAVRPTGSGGHTRAGAQNQERHGLCSRRTFTALVSALESP